ncbi:hypothetical protein BDA99DRAFT_577039 [Phascolomyces articulosus]|uniref:Uncharacterized protein n=1 Tax=Phascolomyces articulosus TaxID=60185 RepID=A0AAD5JLX7_9FUNG|nr:hypothetical protein BDA99DRAFT_577035 [Phascolomyces articulosus]KAI9244981.1 hypothetical protein BDA99DRAFT_577039 [Phascolomyces articulosus]
MNYQDTTFKVDRTEKSFYLEQVTQYSRCILLYIQPRRKYGRKYKYQKKYSKHSFFYAFKNHIDPNSVDEITYSKNTIYCYIKEQSAVQQIKYELIKNQDKDEKKYHKHQIQRITTYNSY